MSYKSVSIGFYEVLEIYFSGDMLFLQAIFLEISVVTTVKKRETALQIQITSLRSPPNTAHLKKKEIAQNIFSERFYPNSLPLKSNSLIATVSSGHSVS